MHRRHQALLTKAAYLDNDKARAMAKSIHPSWDLDDDLSSDTTKVFHRPDTKHTFVSVRGTKLNSPTDHIANAMYFVGLGKHSKRYKDAKAITDRVLVKYGGEVTEVVGHSLGGNITSSLAHDTGLKAASFNKGRTLMPQRSSQSESAVRNPLDPFSGHGIGLVPLVSGHQQQQLVATRHPHGMDQFTVRRQPYQQIPWDRPNSDSAKF